jgi:hypothetical protein
MARVAADRPKSEFVTSSTAIVVLNSRLLFRWLQDIHL